MNLDSWIFCWLLPVDCSMICLHVRMKQSQSFSQDQIFYCLPSAPSCCLHISDTSLSKHFQFQVVQWLSFSVCSVSIIARAGCVSAQGTGGCGCVSVLFWAVLACGGAGHGLCCSVALRESGLYWGCWVNGSQLWERRCWQGEVIPVFCQVRHWKCQCAAKVCHPFLVSDEQIQSLGYTKSNVLLLDHIS